MLYNSHKQHLWFKGVDYQQCLSQLYEDAIVFVYHQLQVSLSHWNPMWIVLLQLKWQLYAQDQPNIYRLQLHLSPSLILKIKLILDLSLFMKLFLRFPLLVYAQDCTHTCVLFEFRATLVLLHPNHKASFHLLLQENNKRRMQCK